MIWDMLTKPYFMWTLLDALLLVTVFAVLYGGGWFVWWVVKRMREWEKKL